MRRLLLCCSIAAALSGADAAFAQSSAREVAAGRKVALDLCTPCHVVAKNQPSEPILMQRTPSFEEIANRPGMSTQTLRHFVTSTHWDEKSVPITMPAPMLQPGQVNEVVAYILSLRKSPKR